MGCQSELVINSASELITHHQVERLSLALNAFPHLEMSACQPATFCIVARMRLEVDLDWVASLSAPRLARAGVLPLLFDSFSISVLATPATKIFLPLFLWKFPLAKSFTQENASSVALLKRPSLTATSAILTHTLY